MIITRIAAATLLSALSATTTEASIDGGFQSGPSAGAFYAGGLSYTPSLNRALLTGIHYNEALSAPDGSGKAGMLGSGLDSASKCYVGKIDFDAAAASVGGDSFLSLTDWESYGQSGKHQICSAVTATKGSDIYVAGSVGEGGLFSDGKPMEGLLSILDKDTMKFIDATLIKSSQDPSTHMIYPLDVIHDFGRKYIYIAALTSSNANPNEITGNKQQPNWQEQHLLGSAFDVTVIKIHAPFGEKPNAMWVQHYPLDLEADGTAPPVFVAGMAIQTDNNGVQHLLLSGSTRGSGEGFGRVAPGTIDEDGFIMQLTLHDGSLIQHDRHQGEIYDYQDALREGSPSDDFIRGMCNNRGRGHLEEDRRSDFFYIVGGTLGDMTTNDQGIQNDRNNAGFQFGPGIDSKYSQSWKRNESMMPFLRKVRISDLKPVWTTQWAAMPFGGASASMPLPTFSYAMDCYLDNKGAVFLVGSVEKGAHMTQGDIEMINRGGDDIWVAKVDEETGNVYWLTQVGSQGNERLAKHGAIAVNKEGNVIIYGETNGNMYRGRGPDENPATSDIFLMTIDGESGAVTDDYFWGGTSSSMVASIAGGVPPVVHQDKGTLAAPKKPKAPSQKGGGGNKTGLVFLILFAVAGTLFGLYLIMARQMKKRKAENQKSSIFACLQQFDVEDIDLRRSPPGGWHGTYMNKLAYGQNPNDDDSDLVVSSTTVVEGAPLTHSSVANDALFMEDSAGGKGYSDNYTIDDEDVVDIRLNAEIL